MYTPVRETRSKVDVECTQSRLERTVECDPASNVMKIVGILLVEVDKVLMQNRSLLDELDLCKNFLSDHQKSAVARDLVLNRPQNNLQSLFFKQWESVARNEVAQGRITKQHVQAQQIKHEEEEHSQNDGEEDENDEEEDNEEDAEEEEEEEEEDYIEDNNYVEEDKQHQIASRQKTVVVPEKAIDKAKALGAKPGASVVVPEEVQRSQVALVVKDKVIAQKGARASPTTSNGNPKKMGKIIVQESDDEEVEIAEDERSTKQRRHHQDENDEDQNEGEQSEDEYEEKQHVVQVRTRTSKKTVGQSQTSAKKQVQVAAKQVAVKQNRK